MLATSTGVENFLYSLHWCSPAAEATTSSNGSVTVSMKHKDSSPLVILDRLELAWQKVMLSMVEMVMIPITYHQIII